MPSILQDVFPATVAIAQPDLQILPADLRSMPATTGTVQLNTARVVVSGSPAQIIIARDAGGMDGPMVVFQEPIDPTTFFKSQNPRSEDSYVTTLSGKIIAFRKDDGCGCGSRLKSWRPYGSMSSIKDPTE